MLDKKDYISDESKIKLSDEMSKIVVKDTEINVVKINEDDYICLTDMLKDKESHRATYSEKQINDIVMDPDVVWGV